MARRRSKKLRELRPKESMTILSNYIKNENEILGFKNHRNHNLKENTFRFTVDLMSLEFLISIMEDHRVKNVYFNPSVPPPGASLDGISLRYKVYVEYEMVL